MAGYIDNLKVYQTYIEELQAEAEAQLFDKFNQASNGAIALIGGANRGDYKYRSEWANLGSAIYERDPYNQASVSAINLAQQEQVSVKVGRGLKPISFNSALAWIRKNEAEALATIADQFANKRMKDMLNTAVGCAVNAYENNAGVVSDISATLGLSQTALNNTLAKMGDMSTEIDAWVMNGTAFHKLVGDAIANSNALDTIGGVAIAQGVAFAQGRPIIVTDIPSFYESGTPNKLKVIGLKANGIVVEDNSDLITNLETSNGTSEIITTYQATYSYNVGLMGYSWDTANGGKAPGDTALFTGTNWDKYVSDDKLTGGVLSVSDADK